MPNCYDQKPLSAMQCLAAGYVARRTSGRSPLFRPRYAQVARVFQRFVEDCAFLAVDAEVIDRWVRQRLGRLAVETVLLDLRCLRHIFDCLSSNPVSEWLVLHPRPHQTLQALKSTLPATARLPRYRSVLAADFEAFLAHKRRLGRKYQWMETLLRTFDRFLCAREVSCTQEVDGRLLEGFATSLAGLHPRTRNGMLSAVRRFFHFLRRTSRLSGTPDAVLRSRRVPLPRLPYIFTLKELAAVLEAVRDEGTWDALTVFTALHLIYACGLRSGEAVRLRVGDVDMAEKTLWIRRTKFGKSRRILPITCSNRASGPSSTVRFQERLRYATK